MRLTGAEAADRGQQQRRRHGAHAGGSGRGTEVIVSRGQLIEIGGSFRLPEVMAASGAVLREVGTTNKTRLGDYAAAIGEQTAALLRVHTSNYARRRLHRRDAAGRAGRAGPQAQPAGDRRHRQRGAGRLRAASACRASRSPAESIRAGADLVLFSGDKLLGGPQCGIIAGRRSLVQQIAQAPADAGLPRRQADARRPGRDAAAVSGPALAERSVPLLTLLATPLENLRHRAERLAPQMQATGVAAVEVVADQAYVGGGSLPNQSDRHDLPGAHAGRPARSMHSPRRCEAARPPSSDEFRTAACCSTCAACSRGTTRALSPPWKPCEPPSPRRRRS